MTGVPQLLSRLQTDVRQITASSATLPYSKGAYAALTRQLSAYVQSQPGQFSIAGSDLSTGATFGVHPNTQYSAAQTEALPVTMTLYSDIAAKLMTATTMVRLTAADEQAGPGYIGGMPYGTSFTVSQLARAALVKGDVVALNMLIRKLGRDQVDNFIVGMGSPATLTQPYLISPQELSLSLTYLYTMDQAHPRSVAPLMSDLLTVPGEGRIISGFPAGTKVAHITGDWPNEFHDAAIIWTSGHPVSLAICSDGVSNRTAARVESQVARIVAAFEQTGYATKA